MIRYAKIPCDRQEISHTAYRPQSVKHNHDLRISCPGLYYCCVSIVFLVYLCIVFWMVDIYMPVPECGYVPFFADVLFIYSCILLFFRLKGKCPTHFSHLRFLYDLRNTNAIFGRNIQRTETQPKSVRAV
jgi:hypothetical protein